MLFRKMLEYKLYTVAYFNPADKNNTNDALIQWTARDGTKLFNAKDRGLDCLCVFLEAVLAKTESYKI